MELTTETGAILEHGAAEKTSAHPSPAPKMLVVLSADELAAAITRAHKVTMDPSEFAMKSARLILELLPPLYYEPR